MAEHKSRADAVGVDPGGLQLLNPDEVTEAELAQFRRHYSDTKGSQNKSYEFWLEFRPDVLKRHKARTVQWYLGEQDAVQALACLHQYVIKGFADGVDYETRLAQTHGVSKTDLLDVLSVAFIHAAHVGMYPTTGAVAPILRDWEQREAPGQVFPRNWDFDPDAFTSGMDYSTLEASDDDLAALRDWYIKNVGEIPANVEFAVRYRPDLLKAYRNRYEHAIKDSLPKQMMPYLMIHYNVYRGFAAGIRENVLLARTFGFTRVQILNAIFSAVLQCGINGLDIAQQAVGDLIETFPDE